MTPPTPTLQQQQWLAGQLPEMLKWREHQDNFIWFDILGMPNIRPTEWHYLVHMVVEKLTDEQQRLYAKHLAREVFGAANPIFHRNDFGWKEMCMLSHASVPQRITALMQVLK